MFLRGRWDQKPGSHWDIAKAKGTETEGVAQARPAPPGRDSRIAKCACLLRATSRNCAPASRCTQPKAVNSGSIGTIAGSRSRSRCPGALMRRAHAPHGFLSQLILDYVSHVFERTYKINSAPTLQSEFPVFEVFDESGLVIGSAP